MTQATWWLVWLAPLVVGCPSIDIADSGIVEGSAGPGRVTLRAVFDVDEEDPSFDDDGNLEGGRGVLGVWLPPGWSVLDATAHHLNGGEVPLLPLDDAAGHFPPTFPRVPGAWHAFATGCQHLPEGSFTYEVEVAVVGPEEDTELTAGITAAVLIEGGSNAAVPAQIDVDLAAGSATGPDPNDEPPSTGLEQCAPAVYREPSREEMNVGCECGVIAATNRSTILEFLWRVWR